MKNERKKRCRYPHQVVVEEGTAHITARYRRARWEVLDDWNKEPSVRRRELFCWIRASDSVIGAIQLFEYEVIPFTSNDEFFEAMDADNGIESNLAEALCEGWENVVDDVLGYGNLVDFRLAWTDPASTPLGYWAKVADHLLATMYADRAILAMKAFPLEYEGRATRNIESRPGFSRRQQAMLRYYQRLFDVRPFPGMFGDEGWLFSISQRLREFVLPPSSRTDRG